MNIKKIIYGSLILLGLYLIISSIIAAFSITPVLGRLFNVSDKIEYSQKLTDSIFIYSTLQGEIINYNLKSKDKIIHFWDIDNKMCVEEIPIIKSYYNKTNIKDSLLILAINSKDSLRIFRKKYNLDFPVYQVDTAFLPLKHKFLVFPYTIEIDNGNLKKTYLGKIKFNKKNN